MGIGTNQQKQSNTHTHTFAFQLRSATKCEATWEHVPTGAISTCMSFALVLEPLNYSSQN